MAAGKISIQANDGKVAGVVFEDGASSNVTVTIPKEGGVLATQSGLDTAMSTINASVPAAYHIYNGQLTLVNSVTTTGFSTTLYTGNGTTQAITTGVDMDTQWGNDASEKFGGLVWVKDRVAANSNKLLDTIRGISSRVSTDSTSAVFANTEITSFNSNGFSLGATYNNTNLTTYASWNFQTTHRVSGTTNHGKAFTCHYNPFTGFTMVKYEGSGIAGHEIPHFLGRKLGFHQTKSLSAVTDWQGGIREGYNLSLNSTVAEGALANYTTGLTDTNTILGSGANINTSTHQYILYGWANSYFDEKNTLMGNYEIGVYQGTGVAGNKVTIRGKPAWFMIKRLDAAGDWVVFDNQRTNGALLPNLANAQGGGWTTTYLSDGIILLNDPIVNTSGGQYLYMAVFDNDSGSGKSKYPRATDTSTLNLNAHVPFANGIDTAGNKVSIAYKNETVTLSNSLTQGKNYIALLNDGSYVATPYEPMYLMRNRSKVGENPDYFDVNTQKWYSTTGGNELVVNGTFSSGVTTGWTANGATLSVVNNTLKVAQGANPYTYAYQGIPTVVGKKYKVRVTNIAGTFASPYCFVSSTINAYGTTAVYSNSLATSSTSVFTGNQEFTFVAQTTVSYIYVGVPSSGTGDDVYFDNISVFEAEPTIDTEITPRNYLDCIVYADQNGQPEYVEQLPKTEYVDTLSLDNLTYKGNEIGGFLGIGQTWQDVTASRVLGTTYTNTSGKPILVAILATNSVPYNITLTISGLAIPQAGYGSGGGYTGATFLVPNGATYVLSGVTTINKWLELR